MRENCLNQNFLEYFGDLPKMVNGTFCLTEFYVTKEKPRTETEHYIGDITLVEANNMDQYVDSYIQELIRPSVVRRIKGLTRS